MITLDLFTSANPSRLEPGDRCSDVLTGATGVITSIVFWQNACINARVQPTTLTESGGMKDSFELPMTRLTLRPVLPEDEQRKALPMFSDMEFIAPLPLGSHAVHKASKLKGQIEAVVFSAGRGVYYAWRPLGTIEGRVAELVWCDEPDLEGDVAPPARRTTGGSLGAETPKQF